MTVQTARAWLIVSSLTLTGCTFVFFLIAPTVGYPLEWDQSIRVFEIVLPVFLGYLGTAAHFVFRNAAAGDRPVVLRQEVNSLVGLLVVGPLVVFLVATLAIVIAFGYSNRPTATPGGGMSIEALAGSFTAALGLLTATTNVAVSYLFSLADAPEKTVQGG